MDGHAAYLRRLIDEARVHHPELRALSGPGSVGVVAGLTELTLRAVMDEEPLDGADHLESAVAFITAFVSPRT
jgi:hypothetical protein